VGAAVGRRLEGMNPGPLERQSVHAAHPRAMLGAQRACAWRAPPRHRARRSACARCGWGGSGRTGGVAVAAQRRQNAAQRTRQPGGLRTLGGSARSRRDSDEKMRACRFRGSRRRDAMAIAVLPRLVVRLSVAVLLARLDCACASLNPYPGSRPCPSTHRSRRARPPHPADS
jgi:hypothetical protein